MSDEARQGHFEKAATAVLFALTAVAGWVPFFYASLREPFADPPLLLLSGGLAVMSLALIYDTAERLVGQGRGIYATAIACSFPPVGAVIADTPLMPITAMMFIVAAAGWLAARTEGDYRRFMTAILAALMLIAGFMFSLFVTGLALLFPLYLLGEREGGGKLPVAITAACFVVGAALRGVLSPDLPLIVDIPFPEDLPGQKAVLLSLPWTAWMVPMMVGPLWLRSTIGFRHLAAAITLVLLFGIGLYLRTHPLVLGAAAMPVLAISVTELCGTWFAAKQRAQRRLLKVPVIISIHGVGLVAVGYFAPIPWIGSVTSVQMGVAAVISVVVLITAIRHLPRWAFGAMVASGFLLGSLWWHRPALLEEPSVQESTISPWTLVVIAAVVAVAVSIGARILYGRNMPRAARRAGDLCTFGLDNLRSFRNTGRREWIGESVHIEIAAEEQFRFAVFGDVTGSEFPVTTRRGGYYVYRELARQLGREDIRFAVSVGDLATRAAVAPYRRLRQLLRHIPVPLLVTPGNHDLFSDEDYRPQLFHSLFGPDNSVIDVGGVRLIMLNNARGRLYDDQYDWLERTLEASDTGFKLVFCHKPPLDPREHEYYGMEDREGALRLRRIFEEHRVSAVFSGHIHELLTAEEDGVSYVISGGGGSKLDSAAATHHFLVVDVTGEEIVVHARPIHVGRASQRIEPFEFELRLRTRS